MKTETGIYRYRAVGAGFTLIEIMLVLAIIAMLMGVGIWKLSGVLDKGKEVRINGDIGVIKTALVRYAIDAGSYPNTDQGLRALVEDPGNVRNWAPALDEALYDPWGNEYGYRFPGKFSPPGKPDIFSRGPDGQEGTEDDMGSWSSGKVKNG